MKYMLLIHQDAAPTPRSSEEWERLSEDEQKAIFSEFKIPKRGERAMSGWRGFGMCPSLSRPRRG